jgi:hypothetical protein
MSSPATRVGHAHHEESNVRTSSLTALLSAALGLAACNLSVKDDLKDADDTIEESIPDVDVDLNIKVCGDQTLGDLFKADGLSDECRDKVESFLPSPQSSFDSRVVVLGHRTEADGSMTLYMIGADAEGKALFTSAPTDVKVSWDIGAEQPLPVAEAEVSVDLQLPDDLLSLGIVNDYSASMRDADLADVSEIETDLVSILPSAHETEVTQFSDMATVVQPFSEDQAALLAAVDIDNEYERGSTALYDGMGVALDSLSKRERPLRVLLVSTDGAENASMTYSEQQLLTTIGQERVCVVMLGALFADVAQLERLSGGACGVFFYARGYGRLKSAVQGLVESFGHIVAVHLPPSPADAVGAVVEAAGQQTTYSFGP